MIKDDYVLVTSPFTPQRQKPVPMTIDQCTFQVLITFQSFQQLQGRTSNEPPLQYLIPKQEMFQILQQLQVNLGKIVCAK